MKKSGQEANMFGIPMPGMEVLQPQVVVECCSKVSAQMEDLGRTIMASMQRSVDSAWDLSAQVARNPGDAARLYRDWIDERRDAFFAEGKQISAIWFKLCDIRPMPGTASTSAVAPMSRTASAAE